MNAQAHDAALADMLGARCIGGPHDGRPYLRGHAKFYRLVLPANPTVNDYGQGPLVVYEWDGVDGWWYERYLEPGEDIELLCFGRTRPRPKPQPSLWQRGWAWLVGRT